MAHDVFISHSSVDKAIADAVCAALENAGIRCWIAPRDVQPGRSFAGEITRAIQHSRVMALIFSANSNASEQILREVQLAANARLHIVQFRIEQVVPNDDLEYYLSAHWLDALTPPLENHLARLVTSIKALLELAQLSASPAKAATTPPPVASPLPTSPVPPSTEALVAPARPEQADPASFKGKKLPTWLRIGAAAVVLIGLFIFFLTFLRRDRGSDATKGADPATGSRASLAQQSGSTNENSTDPVASAPPASRTTTDRNRKGRAAVAGPSSFAFVNMNRIFKEYHKTSDAERQINEAKNRAKVEYDQRAEAYKNKLNEVNALSGSGRERGIEEIKTMEKEINDFRQTREKELQTQAVRLREEIVREITATVGELNRAGANLIIDSSGQSLNGVGFVLFAPRDADMSDRVITALNGGTGKAFTPKRSVLIAQVNMNDVFKNYHKTKTAEAQINEAKHAAKVEYDDRADAYKKAIDDVNHTPQGRAHDDKLATIKNMEREIKTFRADREKQLQDQATRLRNGIVKEIEDFIDEHFVKGQGRLVFDNSGQSLTNTPLMVCSDLPNLTDAIISGLNDGRASDIAFGSSDKLRFGLVDLKRVFKALPDARAAENEINTAKEKANTELGGHADTAARAAKDKELEAQATEKRRPVTNRIVADATTVAKNRGLHVLLEYSGMSLNGVPLVIQSREVVDVTDEVIEDLGGTD
ncbi:MAG: hypothetical protein QOI34_853 [Verrucomicrobiota bacterium]